MSTLLILETALDVCSVAVCKDDKILALVEEHGRNVHAERLTLFCREAVRKAGLKMEDMQGVCVSMGPGSYTGLRIGVAAAKGFCFGLGVPLLAVNTLSGLAATAMSRMPEAGEDVLFCPMIDARRMEVYYALYDAAGNMVKETAAEVVGEDFVKENTDAREVVFFGNGMPKCRALLEVRPNVTFLDDVNPSAAALNEEAQRLFAKGAFEELITFEPFYLKDFVPGKPGEKLKNILKRDS